MHQVAGFVTVRNDTDETVKALPDRLAKQDVVTVSVVHHNSLDASKPKSSIS